MGTPAAGLFCCDKLYDRLEHSNAEDIRLHLCADLAYKKTTSVHRTATTSGIGYISSETTSLPDRSYPAGQSYSMKASLKSLR
jgi:hypothetical protein